MRTGRGHGAGLAPPASMEEVDRSRFVVEDSLVAAQWYDRRRPGLSAPQRLMLAILESAVVDCRRVGQPASKYYADAEEAAAWFREDDPSWPFSFVRVCQALELDATALRRRVLSAVSITVTSHRQAGKAPRVLP